MVNPVAFELIDMLNRAVLGRTVAARVLVSGRPRYEYCPWRNLLLVEGGAILIEEWPPETQYQTVALVNRYGPPAPTACNTSGFGTLLIVLRMRETIW